MKEKSTGDLCSELMSQPDLDTYLKENEKEFDERSVGEILADVYEKKSISKAALARQAGMSEVYLHQVFAGRRKPPGTGCCACASAWRPPWRRPSSC